MSEDYTAPRDLRETPRYTLDEARAVLAREECDIDGHDLTTRLLRTVGGSVTHSIGCDRCGATFTEDTRTAADLVPLVVRTSDQNFQVVNPEVLSGAGVVVVPPGMLWNPNR